MVTNTAFITTTAAAILCLTMLLVPLTPGWAGPYLWEVFYENNDLTDAAAPLPAGASVLLNAANIGPMLGISASPDGTGFVLQGADGKRWRWEGGGALAGEGELIPLAAPGLQQGNSLFLSPETIAEVSHLSVVVDADSKKVVFHRPEFSEPKSEVQEDLGDGWRTFTVARPKVQMPENQRVSRRKAATSRPPLGRDQLDIGLGLGYVQGADWGTALTASGKVWGGDAGLWALFTYGDRGVRLNNSHLGWLDREGGRGVEAGNLYSEIWGLARGVRYSWDVNRERSPSIGLYLKTSGTDNRRTLLTYRDDLRLNRDLFIRSEIGTDTSRYVSFGCDKGPLQLFAYQRRLASGLGKGAGLFGSWSVLPRVSLFWGANSSTDSGSRDSRSQTMGLRIPLLKRCNFVLERTSYDHERGSLSSRSAGLTVSLANSVNLFLRYQKNASDIDVFSGRLITLHNDTSSLLTALSLFAGRRVRLDYQLSRYSQADQTTHREQLIANYRLTPRTTFQTISGFPDIADPDVLRLRLDHQLPNGMSLILDYGRLTPYQTADGILGRRGLMAMLRKTWPCQVPARGGSVSGTVVDRLGQPLEGITVRLGPYAAVSDKDGQYSFDRAPTGTYRVSVADESIPADYKAEAAPQEVKLKRGSRLTVNFSLVPLGCISGRVYLDWNNDGAYERGEGVADVAVCANDRATATDREGRFSFYNLEPGRYVMRVVQEVLDKRYIVRGAGEVEVELQPRESVTGLEFLLQERERPIIFVRLGD
jgi:hypothetical protein